MKVLQGIETTVLCVAFNKLKEQNVSEINLFEKFCFSQSQNNCWRRLISGMKHHTWHNLAFRRDVPTVSKLSIGHYRSRPTISWLESVSNIMQIVLRITNHRGQKFPPSRALLSSKPRIELPPMLTATRSFLSVIAAIFKAGSRFQLTGVLWWCQLTWFFLHCRICGSILLSL